MNKLFLALLLVCVINVSVQAFVKRETPAAAAPNNVNALEDLMKQVQEIGRSAQTSIQENFNPDKIKEELEKISQQIQEGINKLKSSSSSSSVGSVAKAAD